MAFTVKVDFASCLKAIDDFGARQVPFATAVALTSSAQDAALEVKRELPQRFVIRNDWVARGVRITPARKEALFSEVYSRDDFMARQEDGGIKRPSGRHIAIPAGVKRNKRDIVAKANRPKQLLDKKRVFKIDLGDGRQAIVARSTKKRYPIKVLYLLDDKVNVPARFGFARTVTVTASSRFERHFELAIRQGLSSAR